MNVEIAPKPLQLMLIVEVNGALPPRKSYIVAEPLTDALLKSVLNLMVPVKFDIPVLGSKFDTLSSGTPVQAL